MIKKILLAIAALIIIGVCTVVYLWNKPHKNAADGSAIAITATNLNKDYEADEKKANAKYLDQRVEVTGTVIDVSKNQDGGVVITLDTGDPVASVLCTMKEKTATAAKGQNVVIRGFCRGNNLGVVLNDCIIK